MDIKFYGTRGSHPQSGQKFAKMGGHTSCVRLSVADSLLIIDVGSGFVSCYEEVLEKGLGEVIIFLSHLHLDHILGLPFFPGIWDGKMTFHIYNGTALPYGGTRQCLEQIFAPPYFPVPLATAPSTVFFHDFKVGATLHLKSNIAIQTINLDHPNGGCGYRFDHQGKSVVYLSDTAHSDQILSEFEKFCHKADVLIYDTSFTPEEFHDKPTWGHSTWQVAAHLAQSAQVRQLFLYHHAPWHTDAELYDIERQAQTIFPNTKLSYDGLEFSCP
jgi:ribonuclease BN (tRNA processing enzyme)